jgi:light-regulated signal transduction histidine kinase (bacteriophytochrome)
MTETASNSDLTNCDREPIHIPGSIQPHGIHLALGPETPRILRVAGETRSALAASLIVRNTLRDEGITTIDQLRAVTDQFKRLPGIRVKMSRVVREELGRASALEGKRL